MVLNLVEELARRGLRIDLLPIRLSGDHAAALPEGVRVRPLGASHAATSVFAIARYLRSHRPPVLLAAKDRAGRAALWARAVARTDTRIVIRLGTHLAASMEGRSRMRRWARILPMRLSYWMADRVIAVSEGVAEDTVRATGIGAERVSVVRNPVVTPRLRALAAERLDHPWFDGQGPPVLLGAGRLTRQKDFPTLVRAFARVRGGRPCRLVILGEGADRPDLEELARTLDVADDLALPGFASNPYRFMARASLFVLSSRWEGSPNVLTEAMALGTPVASTDCPSGPREILRGGRYGPLAPVGDDVALAGAIRTALDTPVTPAALAEAVEEYRVERSADAYSRILGVADSL